MNIIYHPSLVIRKQATPMKCSHFREYYQERGITHYTGPISQPSSTCLLERTAVSGFSSFLRTKCTEIGSTDDRLPFNRERVLYSNTKDARIHGFTSAELILNYQPVPCHYDTAEGPIPANNSGRNCWHTSSSSRYLHGLAWWEKTVSKRSCDIFALFNRFPNTVIWCQ